MRIKTWINYKVEEFVNEQWPQKKVRYNYVNDSSRTRDENRWIQVTTPIKDDEYIHYEIINNHVELHFESSITNDKGIAAHQELVNYLEQVTETNKSYEWIDCGESIICVYVYQFIDWEDMLDKLSIVINYFDPIILEYINKSDTPSIFSKIEVDKSIPFPESTVVLELLSLEEVFRKNLQIPDYQRIYCWDEKNVKCLLDDLLLHSERQNNNSIKYRLGSVILHFHDNVYDIIDGQQRLVTLSLLLDELGTETCLMKQEFESSTAQDYIGYNKFLVDIFVRKHIADKKIFLKNLLENVEFSVLILRNTSIDLAYTFFSNQNSRGVPLSDYDLLKAHHLRFIPDSLEQQSRKAAETWNHMIKQGRSNSSDNNTDYERTLDTYLYNLRQWMRKEYHETKDNDRHVKNEFEAAPIMPELPPFGEQFYFNEPIQGGTHFFSFVELHLAKYHQFIKTKEYQSIHCKQMGNGSLQWYRNAIETLLFGYYEKFGEHCLPDALMLISRLLLQNRYETSRAQKDSIYKYVSEAGIILMINQATSPTFFLAELYNIIHDFPVKYLQEMTPIQKTMRRIIIEIKNELAERIYVESIKNIMKL